MDQHGPDQPDRTQPPGQADATDATSSDVEGASGAPFDPHHEPKAAKRGNEPGAFGKMVDRGLAAGAAAASSGGADAGAGGASGKMGAGLSGKPSALGAKAPQRSGVPGQPGGANPGQDASPFSGALRAKGAQGSGADGKPTVGDDIKRTAKGAKQGAEIGTKVGGAAGAAVGGVVGGVAGLAGSKRGRVLIALAPIMSFLAVPTAIVLVIVLVAGAFGGGITAEMAAQTDAGTEAAAVDGISEDAATIAIEAGARRDVPWEFMAAVPYVYGTDPTDAARTYDEKAKKQAIDDDEPIGPYAFLYNATMKFAKDHSMRTPSFDDLNSGQSAPDVMAAAIASVFVDHNTSRYSLSDGTDAIDDPDDPSRYDYIALDTEEAVEASDEARTAFIAALSDLPIDGAATHAEQIYDTARAWHLGDAVSCTGAVTGVTANSGAWTNPLVGPISSPYGIRSDPITGEKRGHDGTDIARPTGTPVYAAGSGVATVGGADASWAGPNAVLIDHGNGIQTVYGHMASATVADGAQVTTGQQIGTVGSLGRSTGPHLHFTVRENGGSTDPVPWMKARGVNLGVDDPSQPSVSGGVIPTSTGGGISTAINGSIIVAQANIPGRSGAAGFNSSMPKVLSRNPDFVTLNEMTSRSLAAIEAQAPGYSAYRDPSRPTDPGASQALDTVVLWKDGVWRKEDSGRVRIVNDDHVNYNGRVNIWDRYVTWGTFARADGAVVSVISMHHMTNPAKVGPDPAKRAQQYGQGMDTLIALIDRLKSHGPVIVGGDMNNHVYQKVDAWSAVAKMTAAGYTYYNDNIDFIWAPPGTSVRQGWSGPMASDHPWVAAEIDMSGASGSGSQGSFGGSVPDSFTVTRADGSKVTLQKNELEYASQIAQAGAPMGDDAIQIAFMTVLVESGFQMYANDGKRGPEDTAATDADLRIAAQSMSLPHDAVGSDNDSVGLFQQRNSWGSVEDRLSAAKSAGFFFDRLQGVPNWQTIPKGEAAQKVQISAYPDRYAEWEQGAGELLSVVKGTVALGAECSDTGGLATVEGPSFTAATANLLGAGHTNGKPGSRKGFDTWDVRLPKAIETLETNGVSIAGLQEVHGPQMEALHTTYASKWGVFPDAPSQNAVIWDVSQWSMVSSEMVPIPYFRGEVGMPLVLLKHTASNEQIYVWSVHNPADTKGDAGAKRAEALRREIAKVKQISGPNTPVLLLGDFNDSRDGSNRSQCVLTPFMTNVFGGSSSPCATSREDAPVDHIYASGPIAFAGGQVDRGTKAARISDHPFVYANVYWPGLSGGAVPNSAAAAQAIAFARQQLGEPYVYGANGPDAWDCSSLMQKSWASAGVSLPRTSREQSQVGTPVTEANLQPGDLVFYYSPVSHVAMYIGNGQIIHAPRTGKTVEIVEMKSMSPIAGFRRVSSLTTGGTYIQNPFAL